MDMDERDDQPPPPRPPRRAAQRLAEGAASRPRLVLPVCRRCQQPLTPERFCEACRVWTGPTMPRRRCPKACGGALEGTGWCHRCHDYAAPELIAAHDGEGRVVGWVLGKQFGLADATFGERAIEVLHAVCFQTDREGRRLSRAEVEEIVEAMAVAYPDQAQGYRVLMAETRAAWQRDDARRAEAARRPAPARERVPHVGEAVHQRAQEVLRAAQRAAGASGQAEARPAAERPAPRQPEPQEAPDGEDFFA